MSKTERSNFERKLAFHAAPALLLAKTSNLLSVKNSEFSVAEHVELFNSKVSSKGIKMRVLNSSDRNSLLMVYSEKLMRKKLSNKDVLRFLDIYGYHECRETEDFLSVLSGRFSSCDEFPHEIGLFLDYPVEDVTGYIENKGDNYKICGYWKVYGDENAANSRFNSYTRCREYLCNKLSSSTDLYQALHIF